MRLARKHLIRASLAAATIGAIAAPALSAGAAWSGPSVKVTSPAMGATVAGAVTLVSDGGVGTYSGWNPVNVSFQVDGVNLGNATSHTSAGWSLVWDSTKVSNGFHQIAATAYSAKGRSYRSPAVNVTVANSTAGATPVTTTTTVPATTTTTVPPTTTTTVPVASITRFSGWLGTGQTGGPKSITDAINDATNSHAGLARVEATVPYQAKWNYAAYDALLAAAKAKGVQVMYLFDYTPQELFPTYNGAVVKDLWGSSSASASIHSFPRDPALQDKWVSYAMALVDYSESHYPGVVGAIEWANEPNGWEFGSQHGQYPVKPAEFASLLLKAQTALKAKYAGIVSVAGGTSPGTTNKVGGGTQGTASDSYTSVSPATWTRVVNGVTETHTGWYDLLKAAGAQPGTHFDAIAGHFYDTTIDSNWSQPFDKLWAVWSGPQVWATEQSASSNPAERAGVSETTQATWWQQNLDAWHTKGAKAGAYFAFCNYDRNTSDLFGYYGLRRGDGTPKPAFSIYAARNGRA